MTDGKNPFVLLARITVKEGMVIAYLEIAKAADKAVEKTEDGMFFITLIVIPMMSINLSGLKFITKVKIFFLMRIILQFKGMWRSTRIWQHIFPLKFMAMFPMKSLRKLTR